MKKERQMSELSKKPLPVTKGDRDTSKLTKPRPTGTVPVVKEKQTQSPAFIDANRHKAMHSGNLV